MTGSYSNYFNIYDINGKGEHILQADKTAFKNKKSSTTKSKLGLGRSKKKEEINPDTIDYSKRILHSSWHPREHSVAVAATNNLYLFSTV
jgi:serine/threonine-protein phosphatase 2A regulatory subunit B